ncbi:MAG: hypothetical protein A2Z16_00315 [Chloroflexi bacterium RBG_16_54_18]|nr:MAG: hypothetical protein A2Z16_00315 [Chloroflexi bacterium RBG_16_54_18]
MPELTVCISPMIILTLSVLITFSASVLQSSLELFNSFFELYLIKIPFFLPTTLDVLPSACIYHLRFGSLSLKIDY